MEKEFVPYQEALELKKLGFDEPCFGFYGGGFKSDERVFELTNDDDATRFRESRGLKAPLRQQAFEWLYTKTGQWIVPIPNDDRKKGWYGVGKLVKTYKEAELECLKKLIEIVKSKQ